MKPKASDYPKAAIIAYLIPWLAFFFQSAIAREPLLEVGLDIPLMLWMVLAAAINLAVLLPVLHFQNMSRIAAAILMMVWIGLFMCIVPRRA